MVSRVPSPASARPPVALRAAAPPPLATAAHTHAPAPVAPAAPGDRARRIAELTGGTYSDDGLAATVGFPGAPAAAGRTLARSVNGAASPAPPAAAAPSSTSGPAADATAPDGGVDVDELYEQLAARLRRELLHDRERVGDLLGDLPALRPPR
jgi:hypothetical protein